MSNPAKTEVIIFTPGRKQQKTPTITVYEEGKKIELQSSKTLKVLGIHVDNKMNWDAQIHQLRSKTIGTVKHLHRVNEIVPMKSKLQLYDSLVASQLTYGDIIWSGCSESNKKKLQTVQNFALKSIIGMRKHDSASEAHRILKYLDLEEKRKIHQAVFAHKALNGKTPVPITKEYSDLKSYEDHRSAMKGNLKIPAHKKSIYQRSVLYRTVKIWNSTDPNIRKEETTRFKQELQRTMQKNKYAE